ncbi:MAG: hypothetical protein IJ236_02560, partial [Oscillospiraceae bacterium]|nr:hypothetical protein [Oscillospiraceae bacterium]
AFVLTLFGTVSDTASQVDIGGTFESILDTRAAAQTLGLQIPAAGWLGVVMQLVLTIGIALTASIILGGLVEDAKGSQTASLPILVCTMFPYLFSMLSDIRSMEGVPRILMLCIPFTHTFIATSCMRFHDMPLFWFGLAYQAVFLGVMIFAAVRLYQSDLLFVHSRKYRKRKIHAD